MKLEMGESMMLSWLRHVKGCQVVQTNWKPSPVWEYDSECKEDQAIGFALDIEDYFARDFQDAHPELIEQCFGNTKEYVNGKVNFSVFKKNTDIGQIISQTECDLIGIDLSGSEHKLYAVEVAYHSGGLNYGSKSKTIMKVIEKLTRVAICMDLFFDNREGEIIFASPRINPGILNPLEVAIADLQTIFQKKNFDIKLSLICNEMFNEYLLSPLKDISEDITDTSELFLRSYQLVKLFDNVRNEPVPAPVENEVHEHELLVPNVVNAYFGKANDKIPRWATRPQQYNHKILRSYFEALNRNGSATVSTMKKICCEEYGMEERSFDTGYISMKIDAERSHGKVFEDNGDKVWIWSKVQETLDKYRSYFESDAVTVPQSSTVGGNEADLSENDEKNRIWVDFTLRKWARNLSQKNHRVLRAYFKAEINGQAEVERMRTIFCEDPDVTESQFWNTFNNMKSPAGNLQVFETFGHRAVVRLLPRLADNIIKYKDEFLK